MANDEDLARLRQGVAVWNDWRKQNPDRLVDLCFAKLSKAKLSKAKLSGAHLEEADLSRADLSGANLSRADLTGAYLTGAYLTGADFCKANLHGVHLFEANLREAGLGGAELLYADLSGADLSGADLRAAYLGYANLGHANLGHANLGSANLSRAFLLRTVFADVDLSTTKGLKTCTHLGPSVLDPPTLQRSGRLPLAFLRGCGVPDLPPLDGVIQYYSCFISYSSKDEAFAKRLHADLQNNSVRCWFAPHDLPIGAKTWDAIDAAIKVRDKVLLILSKSAIASDWVENEVKKALAEERRRKQVVLFPVRIDHTVMTTDEPWAVMLRDDRNIGDFRKWKDHDAYKQAFDRVLRDLKQTPG